MTVASATTAAFGKRSSRGDTKEEDSCEVEAREDGLVVLAVFGATDLRSFSLLNYCLARFRSLKKS